MLSSRVLSLRRFAKRAPASADAVEHGLHARGDAGVIEDPVQNERLAVVPVVVRVELSPSSTVGHDDPPSSDTLGGTVTGTHYVQVSVLREAAACDDG